MKKAGIFLTVFLAVVVLTGCDTDSDGNIPSGDPVVITQAFRNLTSRIQAPVAGYEPQPVFTAAAQYTGTIVWQENDGSAFIGDGGGRFDSETVYKAVLTLTPTAGFTFTGVPANWFTHSDAITNGVTNEADSGVVTITFEETLLGWNFPGNDFVDDFDGSNMDQWISFDGLWENGDGELTLAGETTANTWGYYYLKGKKYTNFELEFDLPQQDTQFSVILRAQDPGPGANRGDGYLIVNNTNANFPNDTYFAYIDGDWYNWNTARGGVSYSDDLRLNFQGSAKPTRWRIVVYDTYIFVYFNKSATPSIDRKSVV